MVQRKIDLQGAETFGLTAVPDIRVIRRVVRQYANEMGVSTSQCTLPTSSSVYARTMTLAST
jgi:hypothetical protein